MRLCKLLLELCCKICQMQNNCLCKGNAMHSAAAVPFTAMFGCMVGHRVCAGPDGRTLLWWSRAVQLASSETASHTMCVTAGNQHVQHSNVNLQLLLDIDQTLLYSRKIRGFYPNYPDDPDMQPFRQLARQFWKWRNEAMACYDEGNDWPNWAPSARVNGR